MVWLFYREDWFGFFICVSQKHLGMVSVLFLESMSHSEKVRDSSPHVMTLVKGIGSSLQFYLYVNTHTCYVCLCVHLYCRMASGQLPDSPRSRSRLSPTGSAITLSPSWQRGLQKCLPRKVSALFFCPRAQNCLFFYPNIGVGVHELLQVTVYAIYFASLIFRESGLQDIFASG